MLGTIISGEFLNNLFNLRFMVGLILCVILTISCVVILTHDYEQEMEDYYLRVTMQDDFLSQYAHTNRIDGMIATQKPPERFRPLIIGIPRNANLGSFDDNPLPVLFPTIDLLFIVTVIMSLMAIMFSYDAVSGERESGTLKLMVSNSLSRAKILFGKCIGGTTSLLIPFIFSLLVGGIYVTIHPAIHWDSSNWASFGLLLLSSVIFISIFYLLGLVVSTFSRFSSASILTSLFLWVLLILVVPNISPYISAQLYRIPSVNKIEREINRLTGIERDDLGRSLLKEVTKKFEKQYGEFFTKFQAMTQDEVQQRVAVDAEFRVMYESYRNEYNEAWNEANRIQNEKARKISSELELKADKQNKIAKNLACLSPYANFVYIATDLSGTGLRSLDYFNRVSQEYRTLYYDYQGKKVREAVKNNPTFDSNSFLDVSDRPRFNFREEPLKNRVEAVLFYCGLLLFYNVLFFALAFVGFLRYDVR